MKLALVGLAVLSLLGAGYADEFHLTDETGEKHGPFEFREGEKLTIAGKAYTLSKTLTKDQQVVERMKRIVIPEIDFRQANVYDVIRFLHGASVEFDSGPRSAQQRGVNTFLSLDLPVPAAPAGTDSAEDDPFAVPAGKQTYRSDVPLITFSARYISLHDALNIICKICGLQWTVKDGLILIELKENENVQQPPEPGEGKDGED